MFYFSVSLRIFSDVLSLAEIKEISGEPTSGYSKGDLWRNGKTRKATLWMYAPEEKMSDINEIIGLVIRRYTMALESGLDVSKCKVNINCSCTTDNGQGGIDLEASTISLLAKYNLSIGFML